MGTVAHSLLHEQLLLRRTQLSRALGTLEGEEVAHLLTQVDSALERMQQNTYGICNNCAEPIEAESLIRDPLARVCLDCLSSGQKKDLERDLEIAGQIQSALLPQRHIDEAGWEIAYAYRPLGPVSGDHCDVIRSPSGELHFLFGDVAGKGISASLLTAHLHALFRSLVPLNLPLRELLRRANRLFFESTLPSSYVTLVTGKLARNGRIELSNAGHSPVFFVSADHIEAIPANGLPFGLFLETEFLAHEVELGAGEALFLHTDGFSEALNETGEEYGHRRVSEALQDTFGLGAPDMVDSSLMQLRIFTRRTALRDDLSVMAIRRSA